MSVVPGLVTLRGCQRAWLRPDLLAALSLWAVLIPQAFAYAQLAGLPGATGLYTALGARLGYAFFGAARKLNMGPESSVAIVVASVLAPLAGADPQRYAALASLLALMVVGYLLRAGVIMRLFSTPVLTGYLAGSGVVIVASQLTKVTGIKADVLQGIIVGVVVSLLEVLRRAAMPYTAVLGRTGDGEAYRDIDNYHDAETLPGLVVYRFDAPLFFANADTLRTELRELMAQGDPPVKRLVLNAEGIYDLGTTGVEALERILDDCDSRGVRLEFARVRTSVRDLMRAAGLEDRLEPEQFHQRVADAVASYLADFPDAIPSVRQAAKSRSTLRAKLCGLIHRIWPWSR